MNTPTHPLRVLSFSGEELVPKSVAIRERQAATRANQAAQKLPANVQDWLVSFTAAWLQQHAAPAVQEWLEERTNRPILVSIPRASRLIDLSESTVERMVADGHLPVVRVGARVLIRRTDLEAWAEGLPAREVAR